MTRGSRQARRAHGRPRAAYRREPDFATTLKAIGDDTIARLGCAYELPRALGGDESIVLDVSGATRVLRRLSSPAECAGGDGYVVDAASSRIRLCPTSCEATEHVAIATPCGASTTR